uniref:G protein-coupled receptor n=1 Tax=Ditylenchus dipsaci TaxID=166011 RepID=A0A915ETQ1_9BILA
MIDTFYTINFWLAFACGMTLNIVLIWLICKRSTNEMKAYSRILMQACIIDIYTLVVAAIGEPVYFIYEGVPMVFLNDRAAYKSEALRFTLVQLWYFGLYIATGSCAIQFLYRYLMLCRGMEVTTVLYAIMLGISAFLVWMINCAAYIASYPKDYELTGKKVGLYWNTNGDEVIIGAFADPRSNSWLACCTAITFYNLFCYAIIVFCGLRIRNESRTFIYFICAGIFAINLSSVNIVFLVATVQQATLYAIVYILPPLIWYPVMSPLITIFAIKPFRRFFISLKRNRLKIILLMFAQQGLDLSAILLKSSKK